MNPTNYKALQKIKAINGSYHMEDGDVATVYGINKYSYYSEDFPDYKEKTTIYKILYDGKVLQIKLEKIYMVVHTKS